MHQIRRFIRFAKNGQFLIVGAIFLLSLLTFNILFEASSPDAYPRELLAALIGTILAAVVTTLLLNQQSAGEELKERNVEVFRKKIATYENFIDRALLHSEDDELSDDEVRELRRSIFSMSLVSNAETIAVLVDFVRTLHIGDRYGEITDVIGAFRKELRLDDLDESTLDEFVAVDAKLRGVLDQVQIQSTRALLDEAAGAILEGLIGLSPDLAEGAQFQESSGAHDGAEVYLELSSGISCHLSLPYGLETVLIEGQINLDNVPIKRRGQLFSDAVALGFAADDELSNTPVFRLVLDKDSATSPEDGPPLLTIAQLVQALGAIESSAKGKST